MFEDTLATPVTTLFNKLFTSSSLLLFWEKEVFVVKEKMWSLKALLVRNVLGSNQ